MGATEWVMIGTAMFVQIVALIGTYIRVQVKLKELDMKIESMKTEVDNTRSSLNLHERQNERTFDKLEEKMDDFQKSLFKEVNEIKKILMSKN